MYDFDADLPLFYSTSEFAEDAVWTPVAGGGPFTIQVIFDNAYAERNIGEVGDATRTPQCTASNVQLAQGSGVKRNDALLIRGVTYKVREIHQDEDARPGETLIILGKS